MDWATSTLAGAAQGHGYMGNELTIRGCFGHTMVGLDGSGKRSKRNRGKILLREGELDGSEWLQLRTVKVELQMIIERIFTAATTL